LVSKVEIFTLFCYKFIQVTACKKIGLLDQVIAKRKKGAFFASHCSQTTHWPCESQSASDHNENQN